MVLNIVGGGYIQNPNFATADGEMGIAAGGLIQQSILPDPHPKGAWDGDKTSMFSIHLHPSFLSI